MSRLVLVRVGDINGLWSTCKSSGKWSSPEIHEQVVRNMFIEGYTTYVIFVSTGDKLIAASKVTSVRERNENDAIPKSNELGELQTIFTFDTNAIADLTNPLTNAYVSLVNYVKYKCGSQILIPADIADTINPKIDNLISLSRTSIYRGNTTVLNENYYWTNLNMNGC